MTQSRDKKRKRSKYLVKGSIIAALIAFSPYLFYSYEGFPETNIWETSFFTYESLYYQDIRTVAWVSLGKVVPLLLLLVWFVTCKHWWYHVILIPISMYAFQLINVFGEDNTVDADMIYYIIPIMMIIIPFVYLIRIKLFDKYVNKIDLKELDRELKEYEKKETVQEFYKQKRDKNKVSA